MAPPDFPLVPGIAGALDRTRFEVLHLWPKTFSARPNKWLGAADHQILFPDDSLSEARDAIADLELDILIRCVISSFHYFLSHARLAPVQCGLCEPAWYDGVPTFDYYIGWKRAEPTQPERFYSGSTALLTRPPYWVEGDHTNPAVLGRKDFNLPQQARWYVCPSTQAKFHPSFDVVLARLLEADSQGVLVLLHGKGSSISALGRRLRAALGSSANRLLLLPRLPEHQCHALLGLADAVLDSWPIGGMSSSFAAIHAGIPTVTLPSEQPFGRTLAALYEYIGVTDLIAADHEDYVRLAVKLATVPEWRREIAARIKARNGVLIEDMQAVRELETFLLEAVAAAHRGEPPRNWVKGGFAGAESRVG
jgi:predicted O-linked N-acetylglucosamine transferase (SPINDLY family)